MLCCGKHNFQIDVHKNGRMLKKIINLNYSLFFFEILFMLQYLQQSMRVYLSISFLLYDYGTLEEHKIYNNIFHSLLWQYIIIVVIINIARCRACHCHHLFHFHFNFFFVAFSCFLDFLFFLFQNLFYYHYYLPFERVKSLYMCSIHIDSCLYVHVGEKQDFLVFLNCIFNSTNALQMNMKSTSFFPLY